MRFYTQQHRFYASGDLHARTLYAHVLDADGRTCFDANLPARPDAFLKAIAPYRPGAHFADLLWDLANSPHRTSR